MTYTILINCPSCGSKGGRVDANPKTGQTHIVGCIACGGTGKKIIRKEGNK